MSEKKITFLMDYLGSGGAERVTLTLVEYLCSKNYKVNVIVANSGRKDYKLNEEVNVIFLAEPKSGSKIGRAYKRYISLKNTLMFLKSDVIISLSNAWGDFRLITSLHTKNSKIIMSERNDPKKHPESLIMRRIRNFNYGFADTIVFQTPDAKAYFSSAIQEKGVIIPNPIKSSLPDMYNGKRRKVIVNFCRLHKQKNLKMLIDAFDMISKEYDDYNLHIYGRGQLKSELEEYIADLGLSKRAVIKDFEPNIHNKIIDSAMFVSSSDYEGISNSMLESLGIGLPTICTDCPAGGAKMFIEPYKNGILVPVGDTKALYEAMKYIIENPKEAEIMSKNATKIKEKLSPELICKKWISLL